MKLKHKLRGKTFGRWFVVGRKFSGKQNRTDWLCRCTCGFEKVVHSGDLVSGHSKGCHACAIKSRGPLTHGMCGSKRYGLYRNAFSRAKRDNLPFTITPQDIPDIPEFCPLLGIPIIQASKKCVSGSPTLDKILPALGYTKENVWIISHRANTIKSDASVEELILIAKNLAERRLQEINEAMRLYHRQLSPDLLRSAGIEPKEKKA
jgi:hypothetical protein